MSLTDLPAAAVVLCGCFSFWITAKTLGNGCIAARGHPLFLVRQEHPIRFGFSVAVTSFNGIVLFAFATVLWTNGTGWYGYVSKLFHP